jgi:hypothetical protein
MTVGLNINDNDNSSSCSLDKAKTNTENIRGLNLVVVRRMTDQVTKLLLQAE